MLSDAQAFSLSELIVAGMVIGSLGLLAPMQSAAMATVWINRLMLAGAGLLLLSSMCSTYVRFIHYLYNALDISVIAGSICARLCTK